MGGAAPAHFKAPRALAEETLVTTNDLPVPEGSWEEAYKKKVAGYNIKLGVALGLFIVTASIVSYQYILYFG